MNNIQKRLLAFLFGCIPLRFFFSYLAYRLPVPYLAALGYCALLPALGFTIIYFFRLRQTGAEVFGNKIWWNSLRPLHGGLYFVFAYLAITQQQSVAWIPLFVDASVGLFSFLIYHFIFAKDFV